MALHLGRKKTDRDTITITIHKEALLIILGALILLVGSFLGGVIYQKHEDENNTPYQVCNCPMIPTGNTGNRSCC